MRTLQVYRAAIVTGVFLTATTGRAEEFEYRVEPLPKGLARASFRFHVDQAKPDGKPVRAILGTSNYGSGAALYAHEAWRSFAAKRHCAHLQYDLVSAGNERARLAKDKQAVELIVQALDYFAQRTGGRNSGMPGLSLKVGRKRPGKRWRLPTACPTEPSRPSCITELLSPLPRKKA